MNKKPGLTHLHTPLGVRTLANSVAYCNRCGLCASVCPAYAEHPQEESSPRGRNQTLRLLLEGKISLSKNRKKLKNLLYACSLCGRCTQICPGQIPTTEHMLEMRRMLDKNLLPRTLRTVLRWRGEKPKLFCASVCVSRWLHRAGLLRWGSIIPGFSWIKHACEILPAKRPERFLAEACNNPDLIYLPSLEAEFLQPHLARKTYHLAAQKHRVAVWNNTPSGLFEYLYGDIRRARKQLCRLFDRHAKTNGLPVLTDSFDVYQFLKKSPQLFEGFSRRKTQALRLAQSVRFVSDLWPKTFRKKNNFAGTVSMMSSVLFDAGHPHLTQAAEILHTLFKKNFVQCVYKDAAVAPAAYGFISPRQAQQQALHAVAFLAQHQVNTVFVPSGLVALELEAHLCRFYPAAQVYSLAELDEQLCSFITRTTN